MPTRTATSAPSAAPNVKELLRGVFAATPLAIFANALREILQSRKPAPRGARPLAKQCAR